MRAGAHVEVVLRRGDVELLKEALGQRGVVVLAAVHQHVLDAALRMGIVVLRDCGHERRDLHEVGPGADHREYFHESADMMRPLTDLRMPVPLDSRVLVGRALRGRDLSAQPSSAWTASSAVLIW